MAQTIVDSFHINVGLGDSAIHVLATWNKATKKREAKHAVLVDGGLARDPAAQNIAQTIDEIERLYTNLRKVGQPLRFRSVVVTHWDADHWGGINQLLTREKNTHFDKATGKYHRFYHQIGSIPTTVYAPTTRPGSKKKGKGKNEPNVSGISIVEGEDDDTYEFLFDGEFQAKAMVGSSIIGYDFFTNKKPSGLEHDHINSFDDLMGMEPPEVGMYCVASNLAVVGHGKRPRFTVELTDTLHNQMPTKTNQESIAAIILWSNSHVSHYFAGDLDFRGEALLARWFKDNLKDNGTGYNINFLKSSHHGARNSNPPVLFQVTKPKYVIFSVADHYGHPAWETLLMLYTVYRRQNRLKEKTNGPCILTCYPYWLADIHGLDGLEPNKINIDPFLPEDRFKKLSAARQKHANHLRKLFKVIAENLTDESLDEYIRRGCVSDRATTDEEIFEQLVLGFSTRANSLFYDLWLWDKNTGRTVNELVYTRLTLGNGITEDAMDFQRKNLPGERNEEIDTVYDKDPIFDDEDHSFTSLPRVLSNKIVQQPSAQTAWVWRPGDKFESVKRDMGVKKKVIQKRVKEAIVPLKWKLRSHNKDKKKLFTELSSIAPQKLQPPLSDASASSRASGSSLPGRYPHSILSSSHSVSVSARTDSLDYSVLEVTDWLDDFLLSMQPSTMRLASRIEDEWALLHEQDYLGTWIQTCLGGSQMAVNREGPRFRIITPHGLVFGTEAAPKALGTDAKMSSDGLSPWTAQGTMVFGLDPVASQPKASSWSIGQILSLFPNDRSANGDPLARTEDIVKDNLLGLKWALNLEASAGKRNAIWLTPIASYLTVLRLVFVPDNESKEALCSFLGLFFPSGAADDEPVLDVSNVQLILRKTSTVKAREAEGTTLVSGQTLTLTAAVTLLGPKPDDPATPRARVSPTISVELASTGALELTIKTTRSDDSFTAVVGGWLSKLLPLSDTNTTFSTLKDQNISQDIWFRRLTLALNPDKSIARASAALEVNAKLGQGGKCGQNLPIFFEAEYINNPQGDSKWSISGDLWLRSDSELPVALFSNYEEHLTLEPLTPNPLEQLELTTLFVSMTGESDKTRIPELPRGIPNAITAAGFRVDKESIFVSGTISNCRHELDKSKVPTINFLELNLEARWNWVQKKVQVDLYFWLSLKLPDWYDAPEGCAASALQGSVSYESGESWTVSAEVRDLNLGMLYGFFPKGAEDALFQLLKGIQIVDLSIFYKSKGNGEGTELQCEARLLLGDVVSLGLGYECHADGTWRFHASLGPKDDIIEPVTLGQIMDSLLDSSDTSLCSSLPDFLADTVILGGDPDSNPKLELVVEDDKTAGPKLTLTASIMGIEVEFVQIKDVAKKEEEEEEKDDNGEKPTPGKKPVKVLRLFKAVLTKIPMPKSVPILDHLEQPFDELGFFWVNQDVTKDQLAALDKHLDMPSPPPTETSEPASAAGKAKQPVPGMTAGFHFVIIAKKKVVLDYPIGKARPDERKKKTGDADEDGQTKVPDGAVTKPKEDDKPGQGGKKPDQSSKSTYKNTVGPLSISQIGFRYEGGTLAILIDATIAFGPVALDLMGFTIGLHFQAADGSTKNLKSLSWQDVEVSISGVGVQFHREPLLIAGAFLHERRAGSDMYAGGLTIGFTPWLFQAAGFYGIIGEANDPNGYKCLFAYAVLRGPIMNIAGFAEISGLTGAFGYNVDLTLPTIDNVVKFPLLAPPDEPLAPKDLVQTLIPRDGKPGAFFNPMNGAMFIAAGLTVTAFQMLEMTAVVAVQWSPRVQIAVMGLARCDVPSIKSEIKFAHIELGIIATVDLDAGILRVEAQLSPNSWIVHKSCHLTGGFALYYWFGGGRSDWVMTIGGYHSAFVVPEHYPRPDRLRISWAINSSLSVSGEAYFAITPKVCMGGLRIRAALSLGALSAWFDASADFLMTYKPFHFVADVKVSVGVRFSMDVWFVTVHIAVQVAASLSLMGPPLRGVVHVDFWVFGFDIAFGDPAGAAQPPRLKSEEFWDLVTQAEGKAAAVEVGQKKAHLFSCTKGLITENKQDIKAADPWLVRSGVFQFAVECQFAISQVKVNGKEAPGPETVTIDDIYAKPMRLKKRIDSTLDVKINGPGDTTGVVWKAKPAWKDVPQALWGRYDESEDPNAARPGSDFSNLLNGGGGMARLLMGVIIEAPVPQVSMDQMPAFRVDDAMKKNIYEDGGEPQFLGIEYERDDFAPLPHDEEPWEALKLAWNDAPAPKSAVDLWEGIFKTTGLFKEKPTMLIENNTVLFLSAPLLGKDWEEGGKE